MAIIISLDNISFNSNLLNHTHTQAPNPISHATLTLLGAESIKHARDLEINQCDPIEYFHPLKPGASTYSLGLLNELKSLKASWVGHSSNMSNL